MTAKWKRRILANVLGILAGLAVAYAIWGGR